jgi:hypothetical protein
MKRNEIIGEIKANPDYLRAAERSRSQARDTQRTFGKSPEEKAAARRTEIKRDKGIQGYSKRYNKENPRPKVEPRSDSKTSSGPQDWYGQNRYMGDSVEEGFGDDYRALSNKVDQYLIKAYQKFSSRDQIIDAAKAASQKAAEQMGIDPNGEHFKEIWMNALAGHDVDTDFGDNDSEFDYTDYSMRKGEKGVAEGFPKDPNAPKLVRDRKTGKQYDPNKEFEKKMNSPEVMAQMKRMAKKEGVAEALEEGRSDYVGDAIEGLRMAKPGLEKEDFLDELYSYIDAEMGNRAAEAAFADKDAYDDWYESYADAMDENANMLKVAKDDDKQTILQNPSTGVQTQIDKTNPNAPSLTKDETTGKLKLASPAQGGASAVKPNLVGKDVEVATESADLTAILRIAGLR